MTYTRSQLEQMTDEQLREVVKKTGAHGNRTKDSNMASEILAEREGRWDEMQVRNMNPEYMYNGVVDEWN